MCLKLYNVIAKLPLGVCGNMIICFPDYLAVSRELVALNCYILKKFCNIGEDHFFSCPFENFKQFAVFENLHMQLAEMILFLLAIIRCGVSVSRMFQILKLSLTHFSNSF